MPIPRLMIVTFLVVAAAVAAGAAPQATTKAATNAATNAAPAATFAIDTVHSTALFRVHHLGAGQFYGRFNTLKGTFTFAEGSERALALDVTIPIDSVDTNNDSLDGHLKSPDFFNAKEFPNMSFRSTSARRVRDKTYEVHGDLTMHGVTKPIRTTVEWTGSADMSRGYRCGLEATFTIKRSVFGVMYGVENGAVGDEVKIIVSLEGVRS